MPFDETIEREVISNYYFKDDGSHRALMSGCPLPVDGDDVVRNKIFDDCDIHPACKHVKIDQCVFRNCHVSDWTRDNTNWTNCKFENCS